MLGVETLSGAHGHTQPHCWICPIQLGTSRRVLKIGMASREARGRDAAPARRG